MKALSLYQPWAMMIAWGYKEYETRHWSTPYRGPLVIHAAKHFTPVERTMCGIWPFDKAIRRHICQQRMTLDDGIEALPFGAAVCVVDLVACIPTIRLREIGTIERACGNFQPGRYAWKLANVRLLETAIPARGDKGLWDWTLPLDATPQESPAPDKPQQRRLF